MDDLKKKFAERIREGREKISQNSPQKTEGSKPSTTSTNPTSTTGATVSASNDPKSRFAERIRKQQSKFGRDQRADSSFIRDLLPDDNAARSSAARVSSPIDGYKSGRGKSGWKSYAADLELKRAAEEAEEEEKSWFERIIGSSVKGHSEVDLIVGGTGLPGFVDELVEDLVCQR